MGLLCIKKSRCQGACPLRGAPLVRALDYGIFLCFGQLRGKAFTLLALHASRFFTRSIRFFSPGADKATVSLSDMRLMFQAVRSEYERRNAPDG